MFNLQPGMMRGGSTLDPNSIGGLVLHLDAQLGVLNSSGDPATAGEAVATWQDQSSSGNDSTQITGANRPTKTGDAWSGLPGITFDQPTNLFMSLTTRITNVRTWFWVVQYTGPASNSDNAFVFGDASTFAWHGGTNLIMFNSSANAPRFGSVYVDGSLTDYLSVTKPVASPAVHSGTTDQNYAIDRISKDRTGSTRAWTGHIFAAMAYSAVLSDTDRESVENYLLDRWVNVTP